MGDDALELVLEREDHHSFAVPAEELEERAGERGGGGGWTETRRYLLGQIVVDIE